MRFDLPLYLSAPAVVLGEHVQTAAEAVSEGLISEYNAERYRYSGLRTSELSPVELAEQAAAITLAAAGVRGEQLGRILHAWTYHQGHEFWCPAHYLADRLGAFKALPVGVQQMCNGGMSAIDQAARDMIVDPRVDSALITTADCYPAPGFDRWGGDLGIAYGDGATSVLLTRAPYGPAVRLLATSSVAASELEAMHRGDAPFSPAPMSGVKTLQPRLSKKEFMTGRPGVDFGEAAHSAVTTVVSRSLEDAGLRPDDPRFRAAALPRLAGHVLTGAYEPAFSEVCAAPIVDLGSGTGHLGAGDPMASLADLLATGTLEPGDLVVLLSAGAGFTWTSAVVEVAR